MILVENLCKKFGNFTAVDNISFQVGKGEIFAFLGPNGAGKTTTIKMLTTLMPPTSGTLEIDGLHPLERPTKCGSALGLSFRTPVWTGT